MSEEAIVSNNVVQMTCNQVRKKFTKMVDSAAEGKIVECYRYTQLVAKIVGPDVVVVPAPTDLKGFVRQTVDILEKMETPPEQRTAKFAALQALSELGDSAGTGTEG